MAATGDFDLFGALRALNAKKADYLDNQPADVVKDFHPFVVMQWMSSVDDPAQVIMLNEYVNTKVFTLPSHKKLLWKLLATCSSGVNHRYSWQKPAGKRTVNRPLCVALVKELYGYSEREAVEALDVLTPEQVIELAFDAGRSGDEITKIKKELKK